MGTTAKASIRNEIDGLEARLSYLRKRCEMADDDQGYVLLCRSGDQWIAVPVENVEEVVMMARLKPVPRAASWVVGLLDYHGELVPVVNAAACWDGMQRSVADHDEIVLCTYGARRVGLAVDETGDVVAAAVATEPPCGEALGAARHIVSTFVHEGVTIHLMGLERIVCAQDGASV